MSKTKPKILITRPLGQAEAGRDYYHKNDVETLIVPMLEITDVPFSLPDWEEYDALIFTSANAVHAYAKAIAERTTEVFCVGQQTADAAEAYGFSEIAVAAGTAEDLLNLITEDGALYSKQYLYLRARDVSRDLQAALKAIDIGCSSCVVYEAKLTDVLSKEAVKTIHDSEIDGVIFMSCRSAENFIRLVRAQNLEKKLKSTKALCLSDSVLECVRVFEWASTHVSPVPDGQVFKEFCLDIIKQAE